MTVGVKKVGVISLTGFNTGPPKTKVTLLILWHTLGINLAKYWRDFHSLIVGNSFVDNDIPTA